ncbi:hypothetical protein BDAP_001275 [Binucleata daphniae]
MQGFLFTLVFVIAQIVCGSKSGEPKSPAPKEDPKATKEVKPEDGKAPEKKEDGKAAVKKEDGKALEKKDKGKAKTKKEEGKPPGNPEEGKPQGKQEMNFSQSITTFATQIGGLYGQKLFLYDLEAGKIVTEPTGEEGPLVLLVAVEPQMTEVFVNLLKQPVLFKAIKEGKLQGKPEEGNPEGPEGGAAPPPEEEPKK